MRNLSKESFAAKTIMEIVAIFPQLIILHINEKVTCDSAQNLQENTMNFRNQLFVSKTVKIFYHLYVVAFSQDLFSIDVFCIER